LPSTLKLVFSPSLEQLRTILGYINARIIIIIIIISIITVYDNNIDYAENSGVFRGPLGDAPPFGLNTKNF